MAMEPFPLSFRENGEMRRRKLVGFFVDMEGRETSH